MSEYEMPWLPKIGQRLDWDRLEACVNACAGIPTEQLEAGCVGKLLAVARGVVHACSSPMGTAYELPRLLSEAGDALTPFQKESD